MALCLSSFTLACGFSPSAPAGDGNDGNDGSDGEDDDGQDGVDASVDIDAPPDPCLSWETRIEFFVPCSINVEDRGDTDLVLDEVATYTYDTDTDVLTGPPSVPPIKSQILSNGIRLVSAPKIQVGAGSTFRVEGSRPLLLISWGTIEIDGVIDVSSPRGGTLGAGADFTGCETNNSAGGEGTLDNNSVAPEGSSGGGGGGGFSGAGGAGGFAGNNVNTVGAGGALALNGNDLRGGCPGGDGGVDPPGLVALGGHGGGAIALSAREDLSISGVIHAGGGGGEGARNAGPGTGLGGGGGGGSGGMILLDATTGTLAADTTIVANGGGGGEGGDSAGEANRPGGDGQNSVDLALGGTGGGPGGDGGNGNNDQERAGVDAQDRAGAEGGGGGGGAAGVIVVDSRLTVVPGAQFSPPPQEDDD